jgi:hypothetical protein
MKTFKQHIWRGLVLSTAVWATACSDVSFTPSADNNSFTLPDGSQKEIFTFNDDDTQAKVDVLFVVDNSPSMAEEQELLGSALNSFIGNLGKLDWQIGVTTTDTSNGVYGIKGSLVPMKGTAQTILTKNTPNFAQVFKDTVKRDEVIGCNNTTIPCPSSDERPLEAISMAIAKRASENAAFFRDGADLAVVIVSDEDERSDGTGAMSAAVLAATAQAAFGTTKTFSAYGIVIQPGDTACLNANLALNSAYYGYHAAALALLTGGVTGSLCDADYGPALSSIAGRIRDVVKSVTLQYTPNPDTVQLVMSPFDSSLTWKIEGNQIRFNKSPKKGTRVEVVYLPKHD